jgi:sodium/bile acid cotransporter 7
MFKRLDPFMLLMAGAVGAAILWPAEGRDLARLQTASTLGVALLFFFHGAAVSPQDVRRGLVQWPLHLFIFVTTFAVFPAITLPFALVPPSLLPPALATGFVYLGVLPSAVSSSIAFTAMARGNVPAAICSAAASNLLGLLLTPLLLTLLLKMSAAGGFDIAQALREVTLELLAPFAAGQAIRPLARGLIERGKRRLEQYDQGVIALVIYAAFSQSTADGLWQALPPALLAAAALACVALLALVLAMTVAAARALRFSREDEIAAVFCGSKKSLASGLPLAQVLFAGSPGFGLIILPIMLYNQIQIMIGAAVARRYARGAPSGLQDS